jgi:CRP-like cAMP-binding protein
VNDLAAVALVATEVEASADVIVLKGDDSCVGLYIIVDGEVSAEQIDANGNQVKQYATFRTEQSFGLMALFQEMSLNMTIRTTLDSLLLRIERDEFHAIIREYPEIALRVCKELAMRMHSQSD